MWWIAFVCASWVGSLLIICCFIVLLFMMCSLWFLACLGAWVMPQNVLALMECWKEGFWSALLCGYLGCFSLCDVDYMERTEPVYFLRSRALDSRCEAGTSVFFKEFSAWFQMWSCYCYGSCMTGWLYWGAIIFLICRNS